MSAPRTIPGADLPKRTLTQQGYAAPGDSSSQSVQAPGGQLQLKDQCFAALSAAFRLMKAPDQSLCDCHQLQTVR